MQQPSLTFREVTQANWADMAALFESKGRTWLLLVHGLAAAGR